MALSIGRRLYHLTGRREPSPAPGWPVRPPGRLVWFHAPRPEAAQGLAELARRLIEEDGFAVLGTGAAGALQPPSEHQADVKAFLDHWRPELIALSEGEVRPALFHEAEARRIPVLLLDGREPALPVGREGWFPGLLRGALATVRTVLAVDDGAARAFRRAGAPQVEVAGRMEEHSTVLPCLEAERAALAALMATRPVWLAADVPSGEEAAVIQAHRAALRLAHRLLLILVPQDPARALALSQQMQEVEGWTVALRCRDEEPDAETEVYIVDNPQEYGLWYRLAPVTFLGGSLAGQGAGRNPMEPAALGSAILHGPRAGGYGAAFGRLGAARAARAVASGADLAEALGDLLAPDRAARLAQAAWAVSSDGAEVTDRVLDLIRRLTDGAA
ncbi:MAG: 3-deoxy-D-manno-octulosonic acid transferase [Rhodobacteraceae bacterium]|nr:3-deoxy-D-manno-octulosonic acid transferase [Paracoccaceae bacterium]